MDKIKAQNIIVEIEAALKAVGDKYGVDIKQDGTAKFDNVRLTVKLAATERTATGHDARELADLKRFGPMFGWNESMIDRVFKSPDGLGHFKIVGYLPNRPKYAVVIEKLGVRKLISVESARRAVAAS